MSEEQSVDNTVVTMKPDESSIPPSTQPSGPVAVSEYITVRNGEEEPIEIPVAADNSVLISTLNSSFPGSTGLKFKNPKTGASRIVQVDPTGQKLIAPAAGWDDTVFQVIVPARESSNGAKRRKMDDYGHEDESDERSDNNVPVDFIVLGVDYKTKDETFKAYFDQFGTVVFHELKRKTDGASKGFGFIRMSTLEEQNAVLAVPNHYIDTRRVEVRIPEKHTAPGKETPERIKRLFVGRLGDKIGEDQLRDFFTEEIKKYDEACAVTDVYIPKPSRGFGFVMFTSATVAAALAKLENTIIGDTKVTMSLAAPREEVQPRFEGGYGAYGYGGTRAATLGYEDDYTMNQRYGYAAMLQGGAKQWTQPLMSAPTKRSQPSGYGQMYASAKPQPLMNYDGTRKNPYEEYYPPASKKSYTQTPPPPPPPLPDWTAADVEAYHKPVSYKGLNHKPTTSKQLQREQPYANLSSGFDALSLDMNREMYTWYKQLMERGEMGFPPAAAAAPSSSKRYYGPRK